MGWTSYPATFYYPSGLVNRKAEVDSILKNEGGSSPVIKSAMVGSTWYGAYQGDDGKVHGAVCLTQTEKKIWGCEFYYKFIGEDSHPFYYDCPESVFKLLSPLEENEKGTRKEEWRLRTKEHMERRKLLNKHKPIVLTLERDLTAGYSKGDKINLYWMKKYKKYCDGAYLFSIKHIMEWGIFEEQQKGGE